MSFLPYLCYLVCMNCLLTVVRGYGFVAEFCVVFVGFVLCEFAGNDDLDLNFVENFVGNFAGYSVGNSVGNFFDISCF